LHLDFEAYEAVASAAVAGFRAWLERLAGEATAAGKCISAFYPASDNFAAFDAASARHIAWWVAQLYDAHWARSPTTGPLVTRNEANAVAIPRTRARLAALGVGRERIVLSVPLYGWQWTCDAERPGARVRGKGKLLTFAETPSELMPNDRLAARALAERHGERRDRERTGVVPGGGRAPRQEPRRALRLAGSEPVSGRRARGQTESRDTRRQRDPLCRSRHRSGRRDSVRPRRGRADCR
jgi:hypothetical protein